MDRYTWMFHLTMNLIAAVVLTDLGQWWDFTLGQTIAAMWYHNERAGNR